MDRAVSLVKSYLNVNGYFTVTEYPIVQRTGGHHMQQTTDIDVLGVRFPNAGRIVPGRGGKNPESHRIEEPDRALNLDESRTDMIIAEVKEGEGKFNANAFRPGVLRTTLVRFGCCSPETVNDVVSRLRKKGEAELEQGHRVRMAIFGGAEPENLRPGNFLRISLEQVVRFLQKYIRKHWDLVKTARFKDDAFGFLITLEKALRSGGRE